jgi:curved DNA-binding protein CbpA
LSLELHPDKNPGVDTTDLFSKVRTAYETLTNQDKAREYNRLGEYGVEMLAQTVIDHKFLLLQIVVYYVSSLVFGFLMTFSEPTGDAFRYTCLGMAVMAIVEMLLVVQDVPLPAWCLPFHTAHDVVRTMHQLFPAYMNACRCLTAALYVDRKDRQVALLTKVQQESNQLVANCTKLLRVSEQFATSQRDKRRQKNAGDENDANESAAASDKAWFDQVDQEWTRSCLSMDDCLQLLRRQVIGIDGDQEQQSVVLTSVSKTMDEKVALIQHSQKHVIENQHRNTEKWILLRNLCIYWLLRYLISKKTSSSTSSL